MQVKCQALEALQNKVELLESRERESLAKINGLTTENVELKTKLAVCCLHVIGIRSLMVVTDH